MAKKFDSRTYLDALACDLISEFDRASLATHSVAIGSGREKSIRNKLESVLPNGVGVGSGFVFDGNGAVSQQCDIIVYEKQHAISYSINGDTSNAYYNCECVIAVGEIKSTVTRKELNDSLNKFRSVRELERHCPDSTVFRKYLSVQSLQGTPSEAYSATENSKDQIFTFLFCQSFNCSDDIILQEIRTGCFKPHECFNLLASVDGKSIFFTKIKTMLDSAIGADNMAIGKCDFPFILLLHQLQAFITEGRTVPVAINNYIKMDFSNFVFNFYNLDGILDHSVQS